VKVALVLEDLVEREAARDHSAGFGGSARMSGSKQGCQIVYLFHTQNPNLGIFWRALECFVIYCGHWVNIVAIGYIL
jgi:hypothetical protein